MRRLALVGSLSCAAALALACGSYHPGKIEFKFTPVPYTALPNGTPVSFFPNCDIFEAGLVSVRVDARERDAFERWLDDIGFSVRNPDRVNAPGSRWYTTWKYRSDPCQMLV
jgi:hypothetical protein